MSPLRAGSLGCKFAQNAVLTFGCVDRDLSAVCIPSHCHADKVWTETDSPVRSFGRASSLKGDLFRVEERPEWESQVLARPPAPRCPFVLIEG